MSAYGPQSSYTNPNAFPKALQTLFRKSPDLQLSITNFTLPCREPMARYYLESIPASNLVSLEVAIGDREISRTLRDFLVSAKNLETLRMLPHEESTAGFRFGTEGDPLPSIKDLYLQQYDRTFHTRPSTINQIWRLSELEHLTLDDISLPDFMEAVEGIPFPHLRTLKMRDFCTNPDRKMDFLTPLYQFVLTASHLVELDVSYRNTSLFTDKKTKSHGSILEPLARLHAFRGSKGSEDIADAISAATL